MDVPIYLEQYLNQGVSPGKLFGKEEGSRVKEVKQSLCIEIRGGTIMRSTIPKIAIPINCDRHPKVLKCNPKCTKMRSQNVLKCDPKNIKM